MQILNSKTPNDRIIIALDVDSLEKTKPLIDNLLPYVRCFKVGMELTTALGVPQVVQFIHGLGGEVFLDLKFHDIPNTVGAAARSASALQVRMFNVHASAGPAAMREAVSGKGSSILLAVTVLTSMDDPTCRAVYGDSTQNTVLKFARGAYDTGMDGIVCSAQDLTLFQSDSDLAKLIKVTPGVRPSWADAQDQKRVMTPKQAIEAGATHLVIGRPITQPPREIGTPVEAVKRVLDEMCG